MACHVELHGPLLKYSLVSSFVAPLGRTSSLCLDAGEGLGRQPSFDSFARYEDFAQASAFTSDV